MVISGYCDSHETKSLRIVSGKNKFTVGDHVASPNVFFHHSPKVAGARLSYISHRQHETKKAGIFKFHCTAAKAGSEIIVIYNAKSILTDNSI